MDTEKNKGGRPKKEYSQTNCRNILFELNVEQKNTFEREFAKSGERHKKTFFMKAISNYNSVQSVVKDRELLSQKLVKVIGDYGHLNSNVNQIAHQVNVLGYAITEEQMSAKLDEVHASLSDIKKQIEKLLEITRRFNNF